MKAVSIVSRALGAILVAWVAVGAPAALAQLNPAPNPRPPSGPAEPGPAPRAPAPPMPMASAMRTYIAQDVQLTNLAAVVVVVAERRNDVALAVTNTEIISAPSVRVSRGRMVLSGSLDRGIRDCSSEDGRMRVRIRGRWVNEDQLPIVYLRVPEAVSLSLQGAMRTRVLGIASTANVAADGCGGVEIDRVRGAADVSVAGADMALRVQDAGSATVRVAGAGDVLLGNIRDGLTVSVAGSGDVVAGRVDGVTSVAVQGDGNVVIRNGRASSLSVAIFGRGDVVHDGEVENLDAVIMGSGDVRVRRVTGQVSRRVFGAGRISVGSPP